MKQFTRPDAIKIAKGTCVLSAANFERRARARNHRKLCDAAATGRNDGAARCVRKSQQQSPVETKAILCKCTEPPTPNSGGWRRVQCSVRLLWRVERRLVAACVCVVCGLCCAVCACCAERRSFFPHSPQSVSFSSVHRTPKNISLGSKLQRLMSEAATGALPLKKTNNKRPQSKRDFHWIREFWPIFGSGSPKISSSQNGIFSTPDKFNSVSLLSSFVRCHRLTTNCNLETAHEKFYADFQFERLQIIRGAGHRRARCLSSRSPPPLPPFWHPFFCGDLLTGHDKHSATRLYYLSSQYLSLPQQRL